MRLLSGSCISWRTYDRPTSTRIPWYDLLSSLPGWTRWARLKSVRGIPGSSWQSATLRTMRALNGEDKRVFPPPYTYTLWGTSKPFWVLLTEGKRLSASLVRPLLTETPNLDLTEVNVDVGTMVNVISDGKVLATREEPKAKSRSGDERQWFLTTLHAHTPEFRDSLRTISVYGDSLPAASLFRYALPSFRPTSAGVRMGDDKHELATVSTGGTLTVSGTRRFGKIDVLLDDLVVGGYITG
jgi:hypothetical protein